MTQALVSAVAVALAFGIGTVVGQGLWRLWPGLFAGSGLRRGAWILLGIGWGLALAVGPALWMTWQNQQRGLMGMAPVTPVDAVLMALLSLGLAILLVAVARLIGSAVRRMVGMLPTPLAASFVLVLGIVVVGWVGWLGIIGLADTIYRARNAATNDGAYPPQSPSLSGSSVSLVPWQSLGRWGRNFVSSATTIEALARVHGPDAVLTEPVRVYVGLDSAGSVAGRVELAVRELERAGGFEREMLAVWVPTGTGWMVPDAAAAFEQLYRGNTAIVGVQYSFLPSMIGVFLERGVEIETGAALFQAVYAHWTALPPSKRPKLVLFGKSLGTSGVEASFVGADAAASIGRFTGLTDGALIVGAERRNPIHSQLTRERDPSSPAWQPVFDGGRSVRFLNRGPIQPQLVADWPMARIVYLQHPSDPVPLWGIEALWSAPEWMNRPRGFDVPDAAAWFPVVTAIQAAADLLFQLSAPPGFGHDYSPDYVQGWAAVRPPAGWTDADSQRLERFLGRDRHGESEF